MTVRVRARAARHRAVPGPPRTGRRALLALVVGGLSSGGNLLVAITVTRLEPIGGVGQFALAFSFYILGSGLVRSMVTDSTLAAGTGAASAARRAILLGTVSGVALGAAGIAYGSSYLVFVGLALPGLVLYDYTKAIAVGVGTPSGALAQETAWAAVTGCAALAGLFRLLDAPYVFALWAFGGGLIGVVVALRRRYALRPGWRIGRAESRVALGFGTQFLLTTGSAQLALTALAAFAGTAVVGALSAGRTLLGPVNLVLSTAATLILPHLARSRAESRAVRTRVAVRLAMLVSAGVLPMTTAVALLPDAVGTTLLGANWDLARSLLVLLALESLFAAPAAVGFAGLRVEQASRLAILLGVLLGGIRVPVVVAAAVLSGATGAAGALAVLALASAVAWGGSYLLLLRRREADRARGVRRDPTDELADVVRPT
ncbi:hypothetical protein [Micromonospora sp. RL09-050-HVF-A]|uniref:hypothetical protein n=1 Tax=Micromonospora sp. RL09-050-HVF-A TaxID=1703433 RepID=UPI001C5E33A1|nr:hypothetical protein [Micromonospora sp. RL09-050-HVF-A]MBW4705888.1 hypothetical protein [Micromonospora sp. RL09-050-HVF-A]